MKPSPPVSRKKQGTSQQGDEREADTAKKDLTGWPTQTQDRKEADDGREAREEGVAIVSHPLGGIKSEKEDDRTGEQGGYGRASEVGLKCHGDLRVERVQFIVGRVILSRKVNVFVFVLHRTDQTDRTDLIWGALFRIGLIRLIRPIRR